MDLTNTMETMFGKHKFRTAYQTLLIQMFGKRFEASKLCGGFSGSLVLRVQPFHIDGSPEESVIVKLDRSAAIREEVANSRKVYDVLQDRAAKVLGEPLFCYSSEEIPQELGAFKMELAGACWHVPEFASISSSLLSTFKDLFIFESVQQVGSWRSSQGDLACCGRGFRECEEMNLCPHFVFYGTSCLGGCYTEGMFQRWCVLLGRSCRTINTPIRCVDLFSTHRRKNSWGCRARRRGETDASERWITQPVLLLELVLQYQPHLPGSHLPHISRLRFGHRKPYAPPKCRGELFDQPAGRARGCLEHFCHRVRGGPEHARRSTPRKLATL